MFHFLLKKIYQKIIQIFSQKKELCLYIYIVELGSLVEELVSSWAKTTKPPNISVGGFALFIIALFGLR